jgi:hypothetical protein
MKTAIAVSGISLGLLHASASAQNRIDDGDFDALAPGGDPDNNAPAGAWRFPQNYISEGLGESNAAHVQVVGTSSFDTGASGQSLKWGNETSSSVHLANIFDAPIVEKSGEILVFTFDFWVNQRSAGNYQGGTVYLASNLQGGFHNETDRGPQITFHSGGRLFAYFATNGSAEDAVLVNDYPVDVWQSLRIEIDLNTDRFDVFHGLRGESLVKVGEDLGFRSGPQTFFDRVNIAHFAQWGKRSDSYFDNFSLTVVPGPGAAAMFFATGLVGVGARRRRRG